MHITKTDHPVNHIDRLRQQFALLGQDTFCKALGGHQVEQILREEVGPYRERIYPPRKKNWGQTPILLQKVWSTVKGWR